MNRIEKLLLGLRACGDKTKTATGAVASFTTTKAAPVTDLAVSINPVQSGSGNPSPTNVRPISGFTGANIRHSGADTGDYTTIPVSWQSAAGTVYGGTLDVTTGVLTVKWLSETCTSCTSVGLYTGLYRTVVRPSNAIPTAKAMTEVYSDRFAPRQYAIGHTWSSNSGGAISLILFDQTIDTVEKANAWLAENPTQIVFELANPLTYQLTPTEVTTLKGENNLWSDTGGETTVQYTTGDNQNLLLLLYALEDK